MALTKKSKIIIIVCSCVAAVAALAVTLILLLLPDEKIPSFAMAEYTVKSGERITADGDATYRIVGRAPDGVSVASDGTFAFTESATDGAQLLLGAVYGGKIVSTAVVTVSVPADVKSLVFDNLSEYITDGENISASSNPVCSVAYSLKAPIAGIKIDGVTGVVTLAPSVADGTEFTVTATAGNKSADKTFKAAVDAHVTAENDIAIVEYGAGGAAVFKLDFGGDDDTAQEGVLGVSVRGVALADGEWSYDGGARTVTVDNKVLSDLVMGESPVRIYTARNSVSATIKAARYIETAEDLAAINDDVESLSDYYVMVNDIDLTEYLKDSEEGWMPIGIYRDVTDGTALSHAFSGTFDGNGHTVSGLWMNRSDDFAYNAGLFGFISTSGQIMNLNVVADADKPYNVKSFSGVLAGGSLGTIENCATVGSFTMYNDPSGTLEYCARVGGAFIGRNEGIIRNCYSVGSVNVGGNERGAFVGDNSKGEIRNCFAVYDGELKFSGTGSIVLVNSKIVGSEEGLAEEDLSAWTGWITEGGSLPVLPSVEVVYKLTSLSIENTETHIAKGETLQLVIAGDPQELVSPSRVEFCIIEGDGVTVTADGLIITAAAEAGTCVVEVRCDGLKVGYTFEITEEAGGEA